MDEMSDESWCKDSTLSFTQISPDEYVERSSEVFAALNDICDEECLPYVVRLVDACYSSFRSSLELACSRNDVYQCWYGPVVNNGTGVFYDCYPTLVEGQPCSDYCRYSVEEIRTQLGCCVNNVFNTSAFGNDLRSLQVANDNLWGACGVERVPFCDLPEVFATPSPTEGAPKLGAAMAIVLLLAFVSYVAIF